jgi:hypothetical protein
MTVQQMKQRFDLHPHSTEPPTLLPEPPPDGSQGRSLPGADGPVPVPPGGFSVDPSLFDMPDLRV